MSMMVGIGGATDIVNEEGGLEKRVMKLSSVGKADATWLCYADKLCRPGLVFPYT